ncbi:deoxyribonuclease IV [Rubripirellula sp.]|nr:deoxyribonuclease IV [Rubripirellula sp.]MDB4749774.1 deoxyribonuclease IV [Rubripirellula sp.]
MLLGSHVSCQGGISKAVGRAEDVGCECIQIFVSNPPRQWPVFADEKPGSVLVQELQTGVCSSETNTDSESQPWRAKPLASSAIEDWNSAISASAVSHPIAHASYLINMASPKDELFRKSINALVIELERANSLSLDGLVVHPGSFTESSEPEGLSRIVDAASEALGRVTPGTCRLLLENTAGQGSCLGHSLEQLAFMLNGIGQPDRVGICLDTCHAYAAGYEINTRQGFDEMRKKMDDLLPNNAIAALHLNDSKKPLGSRVDRHEHIGLGEIGIDAFRYVVEDSLLGDLPGYLETEKGVNEETGEEWDVINLRVLRELK